MENTRELTSYIQHYISMGLFDETGESTKTADGRKTAEAFRHIMSLTDRRNRFGMVIPRNSFNNEGNPGHRRFLGVNFYVALPKALRSLNLQSVHLTDPMWEIVFSGSEYIRLKEALYGITDASNVITARRLFKLGSMITNMMCRPFWITHFTVTSKKSFREVHRYKFAPGIISALTPRFYSDVPVGNVWEELGW